MTADLFADEPTPTPRRQAKGAGNTVAPASPDLATNALANELPSGLHLGTSSWSFPGWKNLVWGGDYSEAILAKRGLAAYAGHPVLRAVSLDRSFYRPLSAIEYAAYAAQVPEHFRFVVKAPSLVTDAMVRS